MCLPNVTSAAAAGPVLANDSSMETDELDQAELQLCMEALESSCLLPFLDQQLSQASFSDMASRQAPAILCTHCLPATTALAVVVLHRLPMLLLCFPGCGWLQLAGHMCCGMDMMHCSTTALKAPCCV